MHFEQNKGCFFAFEGIDGCGKSTQARRFAARMRGSGLCVAETCEPTDLPVGRLLRAYLAGTHKAEDKVLAMLFAADRLDHLLQPEKGVLAQLDKGIHVVSDRYYLSNYAFQSRRLPLEHVRMLNAHSVEIAKPTCHVFIDVSPETALARITQNRSSQELYETLEMLTAVRNSYFNIMPRLQDEETIIIINGERDEAEIADSIWKSLSDTLGVRFIGLQADEYTHEDYR